MKLSDKLIKLRKEKGWSQEEFAEKLDVSRQAISRWENGTALPDAQNILRISKLFNVTADYLLNDDQEDHEREIDIPALETEKEETEPLVQKKKYPYLISAFCFIIFIILVVCAIMWVVNRTNDPTNDPTNATGNEVQTEQHTHDVLRSVKENEVAPTCTAEGSYDEVVYCTGCNEEVLRTRRSTKMLAHTPSSSIIRENEVAATCVNEGSYDEVVYCAVCNGDVLRTTKRTAKLAHQFENKKCTACGEDQPSEGLFYMSNGNGTCTVDIGDCTDENIIIPEYSPSGEKVVQIKSYAFAMRSKVKSVRIPETVTVIGEGAFQGCVDLESVDLPSNITMINSYMFSGCEKLKDVMIPAGVYNIGIEAFADCVAFESIVIPASVTKIGTFAFRNFSSGDGTIIFENYEAWGVYDSSGYQTKVLDFRNSVHRPVMYLSFIYADHTWKRI